MKKFVFISGGLSSFLTLLSVLFKLLHWQGATQLLFCGLSGMSVFCLALAKYLYDKTP